MTKSSRALMDNAQWLLDACEMLADGECSPEEETALRALAFIVRKRIVARPSVRAAFNSAFDAAADGREEVR